MKYLLLFFVFIFLNCDKRNDTIKIATNNFDNFQYKYSAEVVNFNLNLLNELNKDSLRGYKLKYEKKRDTTIIKVIDTIKLDYDASFVIKTYWNDRSISNLECKKKIKVNIKELTFVFCYNEVLNYLKSKKDIDIIYIHYKDIIESITNSKSEINGNLFNDSIVSDFLKNISFSIIDNYKQSKISKVVIGDYYTGYSGGSEHYIISEKKDTIAYFEYTKWIK